MLIAIKFNILYNLKFSLDTQKSAIDLVESRFYLIYLKFYRKSGLLNYLGSNWIVILSK